MKPVLNIENVSYRYDRENVLENINIRVPEGAFVAIVGPNGSGKSTLLKVVLGLVKGQQGNVYLFDQPQAKFKDWYRIGFVSQKANAFNSGFPATVYEVVASGLTGRLGLFRFIRNKDRKKIMDAIRSVGMEEYSHKNIGELSGGQQQRVFIARAIVADPDLLFLDEPTVGIDEQSVKSFYDILGKLNKEQGITLILVTHEISKVMDKLTHVASLNKRLIFYGTLEEYQQNKISE